MLPRTRKKNRIGAFSCGALAEIGPKRRWLRDSITSRIGDEWTQSGHRETALMTLNGHHGLAIQTPDRGIEYCRKDNPCRVWCKQ
jgi:hypothetical protein